MGKLKDYQSLNLPLRKRGRPKGHRRIESRDALIEKGLCLRQIAEPEGKTREWIRQYMKLTNQHEKWKEKRYEMQREEESRKNIISSLLYSVISAKFIESCENKTAAQKAIEYKAAHPKSIHQIEKIYNALSRYYKARCLGKKLSLEELCNASGIPIATLSKILKRMGIDAMHKPKERDTTPAYKKEAMKRAAYFPMSFIDISYFFKLPDYVVRQNISEYREETGKHLTGKIRTFPKIDGQCVTYRMASQIYEAEEAGFLDKEITELLDVSQKYIDYARENKSEIAKEIGSLLNFLYPKKE